jgi:hypothetical protein
MQKRGVFCVLVLGMYLQAEESSLYNAETFLENTYKYGGPSGGEKSIYS